MATGKKPIAEERVYPADVRGTLEKIAASDIFRNSPQLVEFLRYVMEAVLRGEGNRLKAFTIGTDVLGRGPNFDPQIDPIVRVEATRLRHAIERYYAGPGANDTIVIDIPRGTYAPVFYRRARHVSAATFLENRARRLLRPYAAITIVLAVTVASAAGLAFVTWLNGSGSSDTTASIGGSSRAERHSPLADNGMPTLDIQQFKTSGSPDFKSLSATALRNKMLDLFARFDAINIAARSAHDTLRRQEMPARNGKPHAQYSLAGTIHYRSDRATVIDFRLTDLRNDTVVWSKTFDHIEPSQDLTVAVTAIAAGIGSTLLQPFGVIRAHERLRARHNGLGDPRYRCILETFDAFRSFDEAGHIKSRDCLERLTSSDPKFAFGFPYLAAIYNREYLFGFGARAGDMPPMDRALTVARRGVELAPSSARAYQSLFVVLFNRKDIAAAFIAGDHAMALNPYDPNIVSEYGGRLILNGEIDRGLSMMRRAVAEGPVRPSWHHYFMFLGNYFNRNLEDAAFHAEQLPDSYPLGFLARALTASVAEDAVRARLNYNRLVDVQPEFGKNARHWLEKFFPNAALVDRIISDLSAAGLIKGS